jgi:type II secretory pathway component GspD/PulD (secretin)
MSAPTRVEPAEPRPAQRQAQRQAARPPAQPRRAPEAFGTPRISLDFEKAEIATVLRAIGMQANVNIVSAPDMEGEVTVSMTSVSVEEALDFLTSVAGLRYAKVNRTFVVAPKDRFPAVLRSVQQTVEPPETRVVPIYSGDAEQIRAAALRALPPDSARGAFDILIPEDDGAHRPPGAPPQAGEGQAEGARPAAARPGPAPRRTHLYVMLVGSPSVLDVAQAKVEAIDRAICEAKGIAIPETSAVIQETYRVRSEQLSARSLQEMVSGLEGAAFRGVEMYPSPAGSGTQAIVLVGRATEVQRAKAMLAEFDVSGDVVAVYDVRHADPRALREQVVVAVPGLSATIPPASSVNPRLYTPGQARAAAAEAEEGGRANQAGDRAIDAAVRGGAVEAIGLTQPFRDLERSALPMRLVLRGTQRQIEQAHEFFKLVDVEPRQVALELRVMEITREEGLRIGLDWSIFSGGVVRMFRLNQGLGDTPAVGGTFTGEFSNSATDAAGGDVTATLDQIANDRNLIARPNLLAVDGRETELFVGDVIRYIESIQSTQQGVSVTTGTVRVGVRLAVHVRVGADGRIALDLRPALSFLRGFTPVPGGGQLPQTSERMVQSTMSVLNGETIAIGGLIRDEDRKHHSGIPILKDIPIIGRLLFSRTDNRRERSEIVFFLTARLVDDANRAGAASPREQDRAQPPREAPPAGE